MPTPVLTGHFDWIVGLLRDERLGKCQRKFSVVGDLSRCNTPSTTAHHMQCKLDFGFVWLAPDEFQRRSSGIADQSSEYRSLCMG